MLPAIAKIVKIIDDVFLWLQHVAQAHLAGVDTRFGSPILVRRQPVFLPADRELPEVVVAPPHDGLDDVVQNLERDRSRHLDLAPDHRTIAWRVSARLGTSCAG